MISIENAKNLIKFLQDERKVFSRYESSLFDIMMNRGISDYDSDEDQEVEMEEMGLEQSYRDRIDFLYSGLLSVLEAIGLKDKRDSLIEKIENIRKNDGGEFKFEFVPHWDYYKCEALDVLDTEMKIAAALLNELDKENQNSSDKDSIKSSINIRLIEQLKQTGFYVSSLHGNPSAEADVQKIMNSILEGTFGADFIARPAISQTFKNFVPDGGIKSIGTALEFKFIDSEAELKVAIDGIYADISGYSDSKDWHQFITILYMTDSFRSPKTIEEEIANKGFGRWRAMPIIGKGERVKKSKRSTDTKS